MDKRKKIENILLFAILIVLAILVVFLYNKNVEKYEQEKTKEKELEEANVTLTEISYGSEITQIGHTEAQSLLNDFIVAYNNHDGKSVISIMDMVAGYIYVEEAGRDISKFDENYVRILSDPEKYDDIILMRYTLPKQEESLIESINNTNVNLELVDNTEIEDISKYSSKVTANIRTYSEAEKIDQVDKLEFFLLHSNNAYYIVDYYVVDENGNKIQ